MLLLDGTLRVQQVSENGRKIVLYRISLWFRQSGELK